MYFVVMLVGLRLGMVWVVVMVFFRVVILLVSWVGVELMVISILIVWVIVRKMVECVFCILFWKVRVVVCVVLYIVRNSLMWVGIDLVKVMIFLMIFLSWVLSCLVCFKRLVMVLMIFMGDREVLVIFRLLLSDVIWLLIFLSNLCVFVVLFDMVGIVGMVVWVVGVERVVGIIRVLVINGVVMNLIFIEFFFFLMNCLWFWICLLFCMRFNFENVKVCCCFERCCCIY